MTQESSETWQDLDEAALTVLVACHSRGSLNCNELSELLTCKISDASLFERLQRAGLLEHLRGRYSVTQSGRELLDRVLEGIEQQITPDHPDYVRRHRREAPSIPFEANTVWAEAICINYRVDPQALRPIIPDVFDLDCCHGKSFISVTASRLKDFGISRVPNALRMNFYQCTYRAHVTYTDFRGRTMKGCYFVRCETNSQLMSLAANMLPEFRAHRCNTYPILMARHGGHLCLTVDTADDPGGNLVLVSDTSNPKSSMPDTSVFRSTEEARRLIVDFYDAFAYHPETNEVLILRIDRGDWNIRIIEPTDYYLGYVNNGPFHSENAELDSIFYFQDCPYRWLPLLKERIPHGRHAANPSG